MKLIVCRLDGGVGITKTRACLTKGHGGQWTWALMVQCCQYHHELNPMSPFVKYDYFGSHDVLVMTSLAFRAEWKGKN